MTATVVCERENYLHDGTIRILDTGRTVLSESPRTLIGRNAAHEFEVAAREPNGYALSRVSPHAERHSPWSTVLLPVADPWRRRCYLELFQDPTTTIHSVRRQTWRGRQVLAAEVEFGFVDNTTRKTERIRAAYYFDPSAGWACVGSGDGAPDPPDGIRAEFVYHYAVRDGWPVPTREELWVSKAGGAGALRRASDIDEYVPVAPPDEADFRLTAFGLPEPVGVEWPNRRSRWLGLTLAATGCVLASGMFVALRRQAARRRAVQPGVA